MMDSVLYFGLLFAAIFRAVALQWVHGYLLDKIRNYYYYYYYYYWPGAVTAPNCTQICFTCACLLWHCLCEPSFVEIGSHHIHFCKAPENCKFRLESNFNAWDIRLSPAYQDVLFETQRGVSVGFDLIKPDSIILFVYIVVYSTALE